MTEIALTLRPMRPDDRNYVLSSWLLSYGAKGRDSHAYASPVDFRTDYAVVVRGLLARSQVLVACLSEAHDIIAGWMAWEGDLLHYVVVKPSFRRLGVARWMLKDFASAPVHYTHRTSDSTKCPIPEGWAYRRYRIFPAEETAV